MRTILGAIVRFVAYLAAIAVFAVGGFVVFGMWLENWEVPYTHTGSHFLAVAIGTVVVAGLFFVVGNVAAKWIEK